MVEWFCNWVTEQAFILPGERVAVALSGGADSVCLLYLCRKLREKMPFFLSAAHVNHGLRKEADEETAFCRELCQSWQIPFLETKGCVRRSDMGIEAAGRMLRYSFFESLEQDKIALAHHKNDQAETILLHLLRGCGAEGLRGMESKRGKYIRPLLPISRSEIEAFCKAEGLKFCTDQSNFSKEYTRNRIRMEIIPQLESINPEVVDALCRTAHLLDDDMKQLEQDMRREWIFQPCEDGFCCKRTDFFRLSASLQKRMVRKCWNLLTGGTADLWCAPLEQAIELFAGGKTGKKVCLGKEIWAENSYEDLLILKEKTIAPFCLPLEIGKTVQIPDFGLSFTAYFGLPEGSTEWAIDERMAQSEIVIRTRKEGDVFCLNGQRQKLKKLFIDQKFPQRIRKRTVIVECNGIIVAVSGFGVAQEFRAKPGKPCLIIKQERMNTNENESNGGENFINREGNC